MYRNQIRISAAILLVAALGSACATKAPAPSMAAVNAVPASTNAAPILVPVAAPAPNAVLKPEAAPKGATVYPGVTPELVAQYHRQGYKPVVRKGTTLFCRQDGTLGTRFEHTTCSTAEQMAASAASGKDYAEYVQRQSGLPSPPKN